MQQDLNRDDRGDEIAPPAMSNKPNRSPPRRLSDDEKAKLKAAGYRPKLWSQLFQWMVRIAKLLFQHLAVK